MRKTVSSVSFVPRSTSRFPSTVWCTSSPLRASKNWTPGMRPGLTYFSARNRSIRASRSGENAVEGHAVAGGLEVACWCDLRVAAEGAVFGVFCRRFGVPLIDLGTVRLPRLIGASRAMDLILTGRPVEAAEAYAIGLANYLAPK